MTCGKTYEKQLSPAEKIARAWERSMEGISEDCPYRKRLLETISRHLSPF
jgi:hypothetical protein